ncbi:recombinase RecT [Desulfosporosinus meridiei]|uniref:Recombinase, phage RecT family n=1 Tax=Desulfosporosinus meridiei (strain ATCC BAA-275 / DSM 13257 / KCTC 12902 / NCIMB 13706 / S10) TaxID=768704 RepID=J7J1S7_DESMD|nr:recombinase RecT [Desulfosporosinus meridiei]AFQ46284.1 recombinase, phage RecT family [Desulfosporosinus meridiei DSM 13257]
MANITVKPMDKLKAVLNVDSVKEQFKNALNENSGAFLASIIDLYGSDTYLQKCDPQTVIMECLKAATLKLPINKQLGFAYVVPYKSKGVYIPQFQLGYKGYIQLAMRTGQYKFLNAGVLLEGVKIKQNILTGEVEFTGEPTSTKAQGYFAYMQLTNGFTKTVYMTADEVLAHAKRYSKSFSYDSSAWKSNFDEMAIKTAMRKLLSHYGFLSTEMATALTSDKDEDAESRAANEIAQEANQEVVDIDAEPAAGPEVPPAPESQNDKVEHQSTGPDF